MKPSFRLCLWLLTIVVLASCKRPVPDQTKYIPKDASFALSISPKNLQSKLESGNLNLDSLINNLKSNDTLPGGIKSFEDIKQSGVDFSSNIFLFVAQKGSVMNGATTSTGLIAKLKDASMFETFLKKMNAGLTVKQDKNYSYAAAGNGVVAGWNKDIAIFSFVAAGNYAAGTFNTGEGTAAQTLLTTLFNQDEAASAASIPEFRDVMAKNADINFWSNSNASLASLPMLGMTKFSDLLKDTYSGGTINFEKGKAVLESTAYIGKDLSDILKKYAGPEADYNLVANYPNKVNGFTVFSFKPELIGAILHYGGMDGTVNQFMQQVGFTMDDVLKAFKGDFAVVFSDFSLQEKPNPEVPQFKMQQPAAKLLVIAKVGDKAAYDKIVTKLAEKGQMVQKNGQYVPKELANNPGGFTYSADGVNIIFASDDALLQQYKAGKGNAGVPDDIKGDVKNKSTYFYVDIASILNAIPADTATADLINGAKAIFKDARLSMGNFENKSLKSFGELHTVKDNENSLVSIVNFLSRVAAKYKNQPRVDVEDVAPADSSAAPEMPDTTTN